MFPVIGDDVVLSWDLDTAAIGESVHVGIGMAADSHDQRRGAWIGSGYESLPG